MCLLKNPTLLLVGFLFALLFSLSGCGGGGGGTNTAGGIGGTGIAAGAVTKRVQSATTVNGVAFTTTAATVTINGVTQPAAGDTSLIKPGMVVKVKAIFSNSTATGEASEVSYSANVQGPITAGSRDALTGTFVVLGQTIRTNSLTIFDNSLGTNGFSDLTDNLQVEVSGNVDASGVVLATFVQAKPGSACELRGRIDVIVDATQFTTGTLTVQYAASNLKNFGGSSPAAGDLVEIKAASCTSSPLILATNDTVERTAADLGAVEGDIVEVEGLITDFVSINSFKVTGQSTDGSTAVFQNGVAADLTNGRKIEAEGKITGGILKATKIEIKSGGIPSGGSGGGGGGGGGSAEIKAAFDRSDIANKKLVILGITVKYDDATILKGPSGSALDPATLIASDSMEVDGFSNSDHSISATRIEKKPGPPPAIVTLLGTLDTNASTTKPNLTILGIQVQTNGATLFINPSDSASFFSGTNAGRLVQVKGTEAVNNIISATEVENKD